MHDVIKYLQLEGGGLFMWRVAGDVVVRVSFCIHWLLPVCYTRLPLPWWLEVVGVWFYASRFGFKSL